MYCVWAQDWARANWASPKLTRTKNLMPSIIDSPRARNKLGLNWTSSAPKKIRRSKMLRSKCKSSFQCRTRLRVLHRRCKARPQEARKKWEDQKVKTNLLMTSNWTQSTGLSRSTWIRRPARRSSTGRSSRRMTGATQKFSRARASTVDSNSVQPPKRTLQV